MRVAPDTGEETFSGQIQEISFCCSSGEKRLRSSDDGALELKHPTCADRPGPEVVSHKW